jgi:hypothetical protein
MPAGYGDQDLSLLENRQDERTVDRTKTRF